MFSLSRDQRKAVLTGYHPLVAGVLVVDPLVEGPVLQLARCSRRHSGRLPYLVRLGELEIAALCRSRV